MEYKSNINIVFTKLSNNLNKVNQSNVIQRTVATYLFEDNKRRIHNSGKAVDGSSIGSYSTKDTLVGYKSFLNKGPANAFFKRKDLQWKTLNRAGKKRRLAILQGGYKALRTLQGRETNYVNLQMSGKLKLDLKMVANGNDYQIGFDSKYGADISKWQERHWDKPIWGVTKQNEDKIYKEIIPNILSRAKS